MEKKTPFETLESKKMKAGRFTIVQDRVRVNGHEQPYDYLEAVSLIRGRLRMRRPRESLKKRQGTALRNCILSGHSTRPSDRRMRRSGFLRQSAVKQEIPTENRERSFRWRR